MKLFRSEFTYRALLKLTGVNQLECCCDPIRIMNTLRVYQTTRVRRRNNAANDNDDESVSQTVRLLTALVNIALVLCADSEGGLSALGLSHFQR